MQKCIQEHGRTISDIVYNWKNRPFYLLSCLTSASF